MGCMIGILVVVDYDCSLFMFVSLLHNSLPTIGTEQARRAAAKRLIERYYYQLTKGCGKKNCSNEHCASSKKVIGLTPNQAAAQVFICLVIFQTLLYLEWTTFLNYFGLIYNQALDLFARKARLCDIPEEKEEKVDDLDTSSNIEDNESCSKSKVC